jgi:hypothetical protein
VARFEDSSGCEKRLDCFKDDQEKIKMSQAVGESLETQMRSLKDVEDNLLDRKLER